MSNVAEDYRILRNQVSREIYSDTELKTLFYDNKYDLVKCLLVVEEKISGLKPYKIGRPELTEAQQKIRELRDIANEKDQIINNLQKRFKTE